MSFSTSSCGRYKRVTFLLTAASSVDLLLDLSKLVKGAAAFRQETRLDLALNSVLLAAEALNGLLSQGTAASLGKNVIAGSSAVGQNVLVKNGSSRGQGNENSGELNFVRLSF